MDNVKEIQQVSAVNIAKSTNKELYIIVTEDPSVKPNFRSYITSKFTMGEATLKFVGFDVTGSIKTVVEQLKNTNIIYSDAVEIAKSHSSDMESLDIPWHRVIRVKTIKFADKK